MLPTPGPGPHRVVIRDGAGVRIQRSSLRVRVGGLVSFRFDLRFDFGIRVGIRRDRCGPRDR
jgi:hypothetical protein